MGRGGAGLAGIRAGYTVAFRGRIKESRSHTEKRGVKTNEAHHESHSVLVEAPSFGHRHPPGISHVQTAA